MQAQAMQDEGNIEWICVDETQMQYGLRRVAMPLGLLGLGRWGRVGALVRKCVQCEQCE